MDNLFSYQKILFRCVRCSEYKNKSCFSCGKFKNMCKYCANKYKTDFPQNNFRKRRDSR